MFNSGLTTSLWMGDLDEDLDETAIISAFSQLGEVVLNVSIVYKETKSGQSKCPDYCFVEFPEKECAQRVLHRLNGKCIPGKPGKRFKLNPASFGREHQLLPEFSLYVGDLSWNVDDFDLFNFFQQRYKSVRGAKVVLDQMTGKSKGFGFVRFCEENDQQRALIEMQHMTGLGRRPIKLSLASIRKPNEQPHGSQSAMMPSAGAHGSYFSGVYSWGGYNYNYNQSYSQQGPLHQQEYGVTPVHPVSEPQPIEDDDSEILEDPGLEINVGKENREYIESSESFFIALEISRWQPLDNIMSEIPD